MQQFLLFIIFLAGSLMIAAPAMAQEGGETFIITAEELATAVTSAQDGDTIEVNGGVFQGSLDIDKRPAIKTRIFGLDHAGTIFDTDIGNLGERDACTTWVTMGRLRSFSSESRTSRG